MNVQLQFVNAWVLYLLWVVPLIAWWWYATSRKMEQRLALFISPEMQKKLRPATYTARQTWQTCLIMAGLFLLLIAAARPQWGTKEEKIYQRGRDLIIALDVSRSMLANDVHPNRLLRAKTDILDLIKELRGDRAALLAFRKKAITLCPLTTDYAYLRHALDAVEIDSAPAGETDIGDAIIKSMEILKKDERAHKAIILISDGEDLSGKALAAAKEAGQHNIPIFTVGLGSSGGSRIPEQEKSRKFLKYRNEEIVTKLNDKTMHEIAEATRGAYIPVGTASMTSTTLGMLYRDHLTRLSALDIEETLQRRHVERYQLFMFPAFLMLMAATFLSRGRIANVKTTNQLKDLTPPSVPLKKITVLIASFLTLANATTAQTNNVLDGQLATPGVTSITTNKQNIMDIPPGREGARLAQKYYLTGQYQKAADIYLEALKGASDEAQQDFRFNAAVSLFKAEKYKEAADALKNLFQKGKAGQAEYAKALGAALYRAADIPKDADYSKVSDRARLLHESGEAFKEAVRSTADNSQSRRNLAVVLDKLPEAQEQAKTAELMAKYEQTPAQQLADQMLQTQRQIVLEIPAAFTNGTSSQIKTLEKIADTERNNADLWIPLKGKLLNSMAQQQNKDPKIQQQLAAFEQLVEATRAQMKDSSAALRDLDTAGYNSAAVSENNIYQFWKSIAAFQSILQEDLRRQTNTLNMTSQEKQEPYISSKMSKIEQDEALSLTDIFTKRFSETIPETGETPPPSNQAMAGKDNKEPKEQPEKQLITAEKRKTILNLAAQASTTQKIASSLLATNNFVSSIIEQKKAHSILKEIEKLLPKEKSSNQQQKKEDKKDQQQQQNNQQEQQKGQQDQQNQPQPQQQDEKKEQQAQEKDAQKENNKDELSAEQLKKLLEKATQRESEHETRKRERNRSIPMSPIDRDW